MSLASQEAARLRFTEVWRAPRPFWARELLIRVRKACSWLSKVRSATLQLVRASAVRGPAPSELRAAMATASRTAGRRSVDDSRMQTRDLRIMWLPPGGQPLLFNYRRGGRDDEWQAVPARFQKRLGPGIFRVGAGGAEGGGAAVRRLDHLGGERLGAAELLGVEHDLGRLLHGHVDAHGAGDRLGEGEDAVVLHQEGADALVRLQHLGDVVHGLLGAAGAVAGDGHALREAVAHHRLVGGRYGLAGDGEAGGEGRVRVDDAAELRPQAVDDSVHLDDLGADGHHRALDEAAVQAEEGDVLWLHVGQGAAGRLEGGVLVRQAQAEVAVQRLGHDAGAHQLLRRFDDLFAVVRHVEHGEPSPSTSLTAGN